MADHNTRIGSTSREVEGGTVLIGGVLREIESGTVLAGGVEREIIFSPTVELDSEFANNSWENIALACQYNMVPDSWSVGDVKTMTINNNSYKTAIIGKNHDDYADGSGKAPLTFQLVNCYKATYAMNASATTTGGWTNSAMRKTHLPSLYNLLPVEVRAAVREVSKKTSAGGGSSTINTTADTLFLLSQIEIFGNAQTSVAGEGTIYDYYASGGTTVKKLSDSGQDIIWWTRSPRSGSSSYFCRVNTKGQQSQNNANDVCGVSFGFCF